MSELKDALKDAVLGARNRLNAELGAAALQGLAIQTKLVRMLNGTSQGSGIQSFLLVDTVSAKELIDSESSSAGRLAGAPCPQLTRIMTCRDALNSALSRADAKGIKVEVRLVSCSNAGAARAGINSYFLVEALPE